MKIYRRILFVILLFQLTPYTTFAQIEITEIMYDLSGSDSKREWVEVLNIGSESVDIIDWRFNDGSNHKFVDPPLILPGSYAIFASDASTFSSEWDVFVPVIDTVMSLNNTEDTLSLVNELGVEVFSISYNKTMGAVGDGYSLQIISGSLVSGTPTPGRANSSTPSNQQDSGGGSPQESSGQSPLTSPSGGSGQTAVQENDLSIQADAGPDKIVLAGGIVTFNGKGIGLKGDLLINARYIWNLGDGTVKEGVNVSHTYIYPGKYSVMLDVTSGKFVKTDQVIVTVKEAELALGIGENFVEITNKSSITADISFWRIESEKKYFIFPKNTMLLPNNTHTFIHTVTGFSNEIQKLTLSYPNGVVAFEIEFMRGVIEETPKNKKEEIIPVTTSKSIVGSKAVYIPVKELPEVMQEQAPEFAPASLNNSAVSMFAVAPQTESGESEYRWYVMMLTLVGIGSLIVFSRKTQTSQKKTDLQVEDVTILD